MRIFRRIALVIAVGALGLFTAGGLAGETRAATSLDGAWIGDWNDGWVVAPRPMQISGTLEGGFKVSAGESWMTFGCPINSGTLLGTFSPTGNGTYDSSNLVVGATTTQGQEGVECSYEYVSGTATVSGNGNSLDISGCAASVCGGLSRVAATTPTTTTPKDTVPPQVQAFAKGRTPRGSDAALAYSVKDNSRRATVRITLFDGGRPVTSRVRARKMATGARQTITFPMGNRNGPMYFCLWAKDAAGNRSWNAPRSDCAWISLVANLDEVSNGCGGAQWGPDWEKVQNFILDSQRFGGVRVSFRDACNLHDAGYGGFYVKDDLHGGRYTNFRTSTRAAVDEKFRDDIEILCRRAIRGDSRRARNALVECTSGPHLNDILQLSVLTLGAIKPGALTYFEGVRVFAQDAYDTDVMDSGVQTGTPSVDSYLFKGARNNG